MSRAFEGQAEPHRMPKTLRLARDIDSCTSSGLIDEHEFLSRVLDRLSSRTRQVSTNEASVRIMKDYTFVLLLRAQA